MLSRSTGRRARLTVTSGTASAHPAGCSAARASHAKGASISASRRRRCRDAAGTAASLVASRSGDGAHAPVDGVVPTASTTGDPAQGTLGDHLTLRDDVEALRAPRRTRRGRGVRRHRPGAPLATVRARVGRDDLNARGVAAGRPRWGSALGI